MSPVLSPSQPGASTEASRKQPAFPAVESAIFYLRRHWGAVLLCSAIVLIPCFWHRHIQATDLGSHVYNAWLAQLIQAGIAPGLRIVPQNSNVLFDLMLSGLFGVVGPVAAEKIAVSTAVLVFFWGGFVLCAAAAKRPCWGVAPLLAMAAYGFIFNIGFFNLYLSAGFSLFALAILWSGKRWDFLLLIPQTILICMSHLLGTGGLLAIGGFLVVMRLLPVRWQPVFTSAVIALYFGARWYLVHHYLVLWHETNLYWLLGADQFVVTTNSFAWVAAAVLALAAITLALSLLRERLEGWQRAAVWIQLYAVMAVATFTAPGGIAHPKLGLMGYLPDRASLYTVVLMICLLAALRPAKWQLVGFGAAAIVFFSLLYLDTLKMSELETKIEQVVAPFKPGERVVATIFPEPGSRIHEQHVVDRACVEHCFLVSNYEPSSGQFRIKAEPGNRIVTTDSHISSGLQSGSYLVRPEDLPLKEIYACGPSLEQMCVQDLQVGQYSGLAAYQELDAYRRRMRGQR
jgi:hypothetical protein